MKRAARKLATNYRTIEDALEQKGARKLVREAGTPVIVHAGDWKDKLLEAVREMAHKIDTPHQYSMF